MGLYLMGWDQLGQKHASFLVAIARAKELFDTSKGIPDQLGGVLGGDGERDSRAVALRDTSERSLQERSLGSSSLSLHVGPPMHGCACTRLLVSETRIEQESW